MGDHYHMLDYIHEGPRALADTISENEHGMGEFIQICRSKGIEKILITGLGSSLAAALMSEPLFRAVCPIPVMMVNGEETIYYRDSWITPRSLVVSISRSGERGSVVDAQKWVRDAGGLGLAVTSRTDNLLCEYAGNSLITREGPEISFPKTKSVLACAGILMRLALAFGDENSVQVKEFVQGLNEMPRMIEDNIAILEPFFKSLTAEYSSHSLLNVVGTGSNHGLALDAAVKVQEASFIPTRGDSTAGLLHGPVGAFDPRWLVMAMITPQDLEVSAELLKQVREFKAGSIAVHDPSVNVQGMSELAVALSRSVSLYLAALAFMPAVQLLAYYWTVARGMNPDMPASMDSLMGSMLPPGRQEAEYKET